MADDRLRKLAREFRRGPGPTSGLLDVLARSHEGALQRATQRLLPRLAERPRLVEIRRRVSADSRQTSPLPNLDNLARDFIDVNDRPEYDEGVARSHSGTVIRPPYTGASPSGERVVKAADGLVIAESRTYPAFGRVMLGTIVGEFGIGLGSQWKWPAQAMWEQGEWSGVSATLFHHWQGHAGATQRVIGVLLEFDARGFTSVPPVLSFTPSVDSVVYAIGTAALAVYPLPGDGVPLVQEKTFLNRIAAGNMQGTFYVPQFHLEVSQTMLEPEMLAIFVDVQLTVYRIGDMTPGAPAEARPAGVSFVHYRDAMPDPIATPMGINPPITGPISVPWMAVINVTP